MISIPVSGYALMNSEKRNKQRPTGKVGVMHRISKDRGIAIHHFRVVSPVDGKIRSIYIGTDNTYLHRWDAALNKAIKLREEYENLYRGLLDGR